MQHSLPAITRRVGWLPWIENHEESCIDLCRYRILDLGLQSGSYSCVYTDAVPGRTRNEHALAGANGDDYRYTWSADPDGDQVDGRLPGTNAAGFGARGFRCRRRVRYGQIRIWIGRIS